MQHSVNKRLIFGVLEVNSEGTGKTVAAMINHNMRLLSRLEDNSPEAKTI